MNQLRGKNKMDPRTTIINKRLKRVNRVIAVSGCKGGVGKSMVSSALALLLAEKGYRTGLFDLDLFSPSDHLILGINGVFPVEEKGILPPEINGIKFMSFEFFLEGNPAPLRGLSVANAIIELLSITVWNELDFLVIDMPPGMGDPTLEAMREIDGLEFLLVTTSSRLSWESVKKLHRMLKQQSVPVLGVIENMKLKNSSFIKEKANSIKLDYLGGIGFDSSLEGSLGKTSQLIKTNFVKQLRQAAKKIEGA